MIPSNNQIKKHMRTLNNRRNDVKPSFDRAKRNKANKTARASRKANRK